MQNKRIGDVVNIVLEKADNSNLPYIEIGDINISSKHYIIKDKPPVDGALKAKKDNILISKVRPTRGAVAFVPDDCFVSNAFVVLKAVNSVIPRYLFYTIAYNKHFFSYLGRLEKGTSYPSCRANDILSYNIPIPTISEQEKIVEVLDRLEALRQKRNQSFQLLDELLRAIFIDMFGNPIRNPKGWIIRKFADAGTLDRGISKNRPRNAPELLGGPYPLIQTGDIANSGGYIRIYNQTYSEIGLKQSKLWPVGTLCITIAANIAKTGILTFEACFPDSVVGFIPNESIRTEYVQIWLSFMQKGLEDRAPESAQKNINLSILRNLDIPVPPIELQNKFVLIANKIEALKSRQQESTHELDNLIDFLMQRYFG